MRNKDVNTLILEKIGSNIRKERLAKNITLKDLSDKLNMSYATVQKYEIGNTIVAANKDYIILGLPFFNSEFRMEIFDKALNEFMEKI